jgi:hypothetical protein
MRGHRRAEWLRRAGIAEEPTAVVPHGGVSEGAEPAGAGPALLGSGQRSSACLEHVEDLQQRSQVSGPSGVCRELPVALPGVR